MDTHTTSSVFLFCNVCLPFNLLKSSCKSRRTAFTNNAAKCLIGVNAVFSIQQEDDKRATSIMDSLDQYSSSLARAMKDEEEKFQFEAENIGMSHFMLNV